MRFKKIKFPDDFSILFLIFLIGSFYIRIKSGLMPFDGFNIDENLWIKRSYNYINFIKDLDFTSALQTIHPGITIMSISGLFVYIANYFIGSSFDLNNPETIGIYKTAFNIPIILLISGFFFSFYYILRKLNFNRILAFLILMVFSTETFFMLESTPVDKFAAISIILSLSFLLVYVNNNFNSKKYLILSSFFAGFGILSKMSALLIVPFDLLVLLYFISLNNERYIGVIKDSILYLTVLLLSIVFIFPGFAINPLASINAIFENGNSSLVVVSGKQNPYLYYEEIIFYFSFFKNGVYNIFTMGLSLFFLAFVAIKMFYNGIRLNFSKENLFYKNILILFTFAFIYFFYVPIFTLFPFYRYILPSFLILDIGIAIGLYKIMLWYRNKCKKSENINTTALKLAIVFYVFQFLHLTVIISGL